MGCNERGGNGCDGNECDEVVNCVVALSVRKLVLALSN